MLNRLRRRLDAAVDRRVQAAVAARSEPLFERIESMHRDYDARLQGTQADFSYMRSEFDRIAPQVAALEHRLEWLRARLHLEGLGENEILERAAAEHERSRIRLELASHYEERLRRLEADPA